MRRELHCDFRKLRKILKNRLEEAAEKTYAQIAGMVFKTALSQFLNKMAYDMAVAVATGAPGQKSLIFDDPNYFLNLGDAVMGGAVDDIAQSSGFTNILGTGSLCEPADLTTKVNLLLSFKNAERASQAPLFSVSNEQKFGRVGQFVQQFFQLGQSFPAL